MARKYIFDKESGTFKPKRIRLPEILSGLVRYGLSILIVAALFYLVFALVFSTEREQALEHENQLLEAEYTALTDRLERKAPMSIRFLPASWRLRMRRASLPQRTSRKVFPSLVMWPAGRGSSSAQRTT